jgi:hypothetical integral membrane protein (TIGR02206 family)
VDDPPFRFLGAPHLAILGITAAVSALVYILGRRFRGTPREDLLSRIILGLLLVTVLPHQVFKLVFLNIPPIDLCDFAGWIASAALFFKHPLIRGVLFYWAFTLTIQALLTPELLSGFPSVRFFLFFVPHAAIIVAAVHTTFVLETPIDWRTWQSVSLLTLILVALVFIGNMLMGTNFMYLMEKPVVPSILDYMGPWPVYILVEILAALGLWALLTRPMARRSRLPSRETPAK